MDRNFMAVRRGGIVCAGALALLLGCPALVAAQPAAPAAAVLVELPAQPLGDALRAIARQAGVSILFDPAAVGGRLSRPVTGRLTAAEAVGRALEGSGLAVDAMPDGSLVVRPATAPPTPAASAHGGPAELEQVSITGSRLKRVATEGPTPVRVYTQEDIEKSGQPTLERFLSSLNEVSASQGEGAFGSLGQSTVQLRGLPLGSTLVLLNGRRIEAVGSSSANFFDLSLIPMAAIDRVEIVPVGSSAVYGGDALAGVVNVILKKSIQGTSLAATLGVADDIRNRSFSIAHGGEGDNGSYLVLGSYKRDSPLNTSQRPFFLDGNYTRFGGQDVRTRNCTPGTVSGVAGATLPGLNSSFAGIPSSAGGQPLQVSDFAATAGQANLCNPWASGVGYALMEGTETFGLHALGERRLQGGWSVFGEVMAVRERLWADEAGLALSNALVPATNPYNPFGQAVNVTGVLGPENGTKGLDRYTTYTRVLGGVRGTLTAGWDAELTLSTTRDHSNSWSPNNTINATALNAALAASTPDAALNPFTAGRAASDSVLRGIWSDGYRGSHGIRDEVDAFVRGDAWRLPAGPVEVIVGGEFSRDVYATIIPGSVNVDASRRADAVFGEARAPLWRARPSSGAGWDLAALTAAARRDHYSDFGSAATYQGGLEVRPARSVLLRGSIATSFKPPTLLETHVDESSFPASLFGLTDPARNNEPIQSGDVDRVGNPNLKPERGRATSFGGVWEPESAPGTRFGLTAWRIRINGLIDLVPPQTALDYESLFPGFIERGPSEDGLPGPVTRINYSEANYGRIQTSGLDLEASRTWKNSVGQWSLGASATRTLDYSVLVAPGTPVQDRLGRRFADYWSPRWKGRLTAGLARGAWSVGLTSRYLGTYKDSGTSDRGLGGFWIHDLGGSLDLKKAGLNLGSGVKSANVVAAIANVFDREPQFVNTAPYYDVTQADWRGRYASVRLNVNW